MTMERSQEIEELVAAWFAAASRGDSSVATKHVSPDAGTRLIGSDPGEVFKGGAAVAEFIIGEAEGAGGRVTFTASDVEGFAEGTVGWATAHLTIAIPDGGQVAPRWSAVLHREDDVWKFVQIHASIPVPNDEVGWEYPAE
jgi:ketosteroid isomerase-like protein